MAKNKGVEPTPAEKYLRQLNPDRARTRRRDLLYVTKDEADSLYRPVYNHNFPKARRIWSQAGLILLAALLFLSINHYFKWDPFIAIFLIVILLFVGLILLLAARDGSRPVKKDDEDEE